MIDQRRADGAAAAFATVAVVLAVVAFVAVVAIAAGTFERGDRESAAGDSRVTSDRDDAVADPSADPIAVVAGAATAMADVRSVEFTLERTGAPVFVDQYGRIALDRVRGQFTVPNHAQAELTVTVNGDLATRLGAIAIDDEVWMSNPVTGDFETLPDGYDIDPSKFFDPENGWQPLLAGLRDVTLVGVDDRGGQRYHVRGTAPAAQVREITVGLVRDQDVVVDVWVHPTTRLVTALEFETVIGGDEAAWVLELDRYGDAFTIAPPDNVRT